MQNEDTIRNLVDIWMAYENYESAEDAAEQLAQYYRIIPDEFKKAPEAVGNIFYRATAIRQSLFDKIQNGEDRPLILRNRKYTSWTWDLIAAEDFGREKSEKVHDAAIVIFQKEFPKIFLNVTALNRYFSLRRGLFGEKEVIIRSQYKDLELTPKDIYSYLHANEWFRFKK